ncbi:lipid A export ATP-binding/permease MsbA [Thermoclostridium stercorarium subsp. thermolacticum DSM 2910]|uniref:Lipid A export ATP-binding/permease MsbA n=1 Tax=Thermoclostridium stercorarium subsp. thermolacticum DSM 2910 TaxID=1121336 RepID=A0A1B1YGJ4_THEST|nr:ABC transporter ATP-binding protein [Thermoclostridium stercorarium]ANW99894.1 lipid A export ATP-binding/permease MsbA [Thermoclostridium stercorarium subsp. thermolacticum DSM 2910]
MRQLYQIIKNFVVKHFIHILSAFILFISASLLTMVPAKLLQLIIDKGFIAKNMKALLFWIGMLALSYLIKFVCTYYSNKNLINLGNSLLKEIKSAIYNRLMSIDMSFYTKNEVGYINSRMEEISTIDILFSNQMLGLASSVFEFIFALFILLFLNWEFLIIMLLPVPLLIWATYIISKNITVKVQASLNSAADYSGKIHETLRGMETIKSLGLEESENKKINRYNEKALGNYRTQSQAFNKFSVGMNWISTMLTVIIYLVGGIFYINGKLSMGSFIAISSYVGRLYSPVFQYTTVSVIIQPAFLSLKRVAEFFFGELEGVLETFAGKTIDEIENITFKDVTFSYSQSAKVFDKFNFSIHKGDKIQITGENGSGKSTLIRLLLKLYTPDSGTITVNGIDLKEIDRTNLISHISYVPQKSYVFNNTIHANITYGLKEYDQKYLDELIKGFGLDSVENRLKKEGDGYIGENGSRLSGGEIQKICLVRALLARRKFYILDEATSNLDEESFNYLLNIIKSSDDTWLVIDHKTDFSTIGFHKVVFKANKHT